MSALFLPLITISIASNLNPEIKVYFLKIISLGWIGASLFANEFYKDFYNAILENSENIKRSITNYLNIQFWQIIIIMPIVISLFKSENIFQTLILVFFLLIEKIYDESQRLLQFLDESGKDYTFIVLTRRLTFLFTIIILLIFNSRLNLSFLVIFLYGLVNIKIYSIVLKKVLKIFITKDLILKKVLIIQFLNSLKTILGSREFL